MSITICKNQRLHQAVPPKTNPNSNSITHGSIKAQRKSHLERKTQTNEKNHLQIPQEFIIIKRKNKSQTEQISPKTNKKKNLRTRELTTINRNQPKQRRETKIADPIHLIVLYNHQNTNRFHQSLQHNTQKTLNLNKTTSTKKQERRKKKKRRRVRFEKNSNQYLSEHGIQQSVQLIFQSSRRHPFACKRSNWNPRQSAGAVREASACYTCVNKVVVSYYIIKWCLERGREEGIDNAALIRGRYGERNLPISVLSQTLKPRASIKRRCSIKKGCHVSWDLKMVGAHFPYSSTVLCSYWLHFSSILTIFN